MSASSLPPNTTPVPQPVFVPAMSRPSAGPTTTGQQQQQPPQQPISGDRDTGKEPEEAPPPPKLRLHTQDLGHPGSALFLRAVDAPSELDAAVRAVLLHLYGLPSSSSSPPVSARPAEGAYDGASGAASPTAAAPGERPSPTVPPPPPVRSITLILRDMDGVAYTTGTELDPQLHKEVHFSTRYIAAQQKKKEAQQPPTTRKSPTTAAVAGGLSGVGGSVEGSTEGSRGNGGGSDTAAAAHEIRGVVTHEFVHCFQHNGRGAAPGGLIEGVADWVRLRAGLAPPHWEQPRHRRRRPQPAPASTPTATASAAPASTTSNISSSNVPARWDAGYQHTAYFLEYLECRFGAGTVRRLNAALAPGQPRYDERAFWSALLGRPVALLWEDYKASLAEEEGGHVGSEGEGEQA